MLEQLIKIVDFIIQYIEKYVWIVLKVERKTEDLRVVGSNPAPDTIGVLGRVVALPDCKPGVERQKKFNSSHSDQIYIINLYGRVATLFCLKVKRTADNRDKDGQYIQQGPIFVGVPQ